MDVGLHQLRDSAIRPTYATPGSVAFDISTAESVDIPPGEIVLAPTGWVLAIPKGACLIVSLRSSTPRTYGVMQPHGIGVIDHDYNGPEDELKIPLLNFQATSVTIPEESRIAQGLLVAAEHATWVTHRPSGPSRGGFGSTNR